MDWADFDADQPSAVALTILESRRLELIAAAGLDAADSVAVSEYVNMALADYDQRASGALNRTLGIHTFRPHEFEHVTANDESLAAFTRWLAGVEFDWRTRSDNLKRVLRNTWREAGSTKLPGGREFVDLDGLISVHGKRVAFEVETSKNLDNGYFTLRQSNRAGVSDYGLMIVPWSSRDGRADEGRALGKLDREFDGAPHISDGPVYRVAVMRDLDALRLHL